MSWDSVETKVETMLRTAFKAATDSAALTVRYRCFWADSAAQAFTFPTVAINAGAAINDGWRTTMFQVPVSVAVLTSVIDDPARTTAKAIYGKVRQAVEGAALSVTGWQPVAVTVSASGQPQIVEPDEDVPGGLNVIPLELTAEVAL